jgi:hypothetical protein
MQAVATAACWFHFVETPLSVYPPCDSSLTAERLQIIYANQGIDSLRQQLQLLRKAGII